MAKRLKTTKGISYKKQNTGMHICWFEPDSTGEPIYVIVLAKTEQGAIEKLKKFVQAERTTYMEDDDDYSYGITSSVAFVW